MTFKAFAIGAALGFLFALPSCTPAPCGPSNCDGCCDATLGKCRSPGNTTGSCGAAGLTCQACAPGESCTDGLCKAPVTGSGGGTGGGTGTGGGSGGGVAGPPAGCGPATADPCLTGCCNGTGTTATCLAGTAASACGTGAAACKACNVASGQMCVNQACFGTNPIPDAGAPFGTPCAVDADCSSLAGVYRCKLETSSGNAIYPGGYCTRVCGAGALACPSNLSICVNVASFGEADLFCWDRCAASDPCRPGYGCYPIGTSGSACWLAPMPTLDGGPRSNKSGLPCTTKAECINPPDDGFCQSEILSDGGPSGLPGGSCSSSCRIDKNHCGDAGVCVNYGIAGGRLCEMGCDAPLQGQGTCRAGYLCGPIPTPDGGFLAAGGRCKSSCSNPGAGCPQGFTCMGIPDAGTSEDGGTPDDAGTPEGYCCNSQYCF